MGSSISIYLVLPGARQAAGAGAVYDKAASTMCQSPHPDWTVCQAGGLGKPGRGTRGRAGRKECETTPSREDQRGREVWAGGPRAHPGPAPAHPEVLSEELETTADEGSWDVLGPQAGLRRGAGEGVRGPGVKLHWSPHWTLRERSPVDPGAAPPPNQQAQSASPPPPARGPALRSPKDAHVSSFPPPTETQQEEWAPPGAGETLALDGRTPTSRGTRLGGKGRNRHGCEWGGGREET